METDLDGAIWVKIDRKRKIAITALLRAFGVAKDEDLMKTFADVDDGEVSNIKATIEKDSTKTQGERFLEVYRRIRPGDLATEENARADDRIHVFQF